MKSGLVLMASTLTGPQKKHRYMDGLFLFYFGFVVAFIYYLFYGHGPHSAGWSPASYVVEDNLKPLISLLPCPRAEITGMCHSASTCNSLT